MLRRLYRNTCVVLPFLLYCSSLQAQTIPRKLADAFKTFENDPQLKYAISSLYVIDAATGNAVFEKNSRIGLAPASTQKVVTSVTAFELLGKSYRYNTTFSTISNKDIPGVGRLLITPSGDPSFGSPRWESTTADNMLKQIVAALPEDIKQYNSIEMNNSGWQRQDIPDGWIWQDLGNYYGAAAEKMNWRENQYDIILLSGNRLGSNVTVTATRPKLLNSYSLRSEVQAARPGSGDNAYIYFPLSGDTAVIKGTIPVNQEHFVISGAFPSGAAQFINELQDTLIQIGKGSHSMSLIFRDSSTAGDSSILFFTHQSPPLDSLIYWFNKKSINLYGEALIKTMAFGQKSYGVTDTGVVVIKNFWKEKGIDPDELNITDGSGLSPLNRVTTHAQVEVLKFARQQPWFSSFFDALPIYNNMHMKSGTIRNVKGFAGYHTAKNGKTYIFSFLVNNYNGSANGLVRKMYKVLDVLK
jgi:D-alanyl-D-alanine carboxypeptidase/D-alanyl-D-alanine-endopeptidase (penicillin-binding protein 4)